MKEIILKLERDQARTVSDAFFPYMDQLCLLRIRESKSDLNNHLANKAYYCLFLQIELMFDKKLLTAANQFTFKMQMANALAFYNLLMQLPLDPSQVWILNLRNHMVDAIFQQLMEPGQDPDIARISG